MLSVGEHAGIASRQEHDGGSGDRRHHGSFAYTPELCASAVARAISAAAFNITARPWSNRRNSCICFWRNLCFRSSSRLWQGQTGCFSASPPLRPIPPFIPAVSSNRSRCRTIWPAGAVGVVAGRFIDERGRPVAGPLDDRTVGISLDLLREIGTRIAVAGGFDKVPALLAALAAAMSTCSSPTRRPVTASFGPTASGHSTPSFRTAEACPDTELYRTHVKKFLNNPNEVVEEMLEGVVRAHQKYLQPINGSQPGLVARSGPRPGKVGSSSAGAGARAVLPRYVGKGLADAVAVGNIFPRRRPIRSCNAPRPRPEAKACSSSTGNYAGDVMNFEMAAEIAEEKGIKVRTVLTTDDVASSPVEDREGRRGVAGNFSSSRSRARPAIAGCRWKPAKPSRARRTCAPIRWGVALEPGSMPQTRRHNFEIGPDDMEVGMGIHGERRDRERIRSADEITDSIMDRIFKEMKTAPASASPCSSIPSERRP